MSHPDRFIALNVGRGDAFYLERGEFSCLVDGGLRKDFAKRFQKVTERQQVDVVVCTHNDSDHANGLINFFKNGGRAKECWLPATWMQPLQTMLEYPELVEQLLLADQSEQIPETEVRRAGEKVSAEQLKIALEKTADSQHFDKFILVFVTFERLGVDVPIEGTDGISVIKSETIPVANISDLATAAIRSGANIRWFDPNLQPIKKAHPHLHVVNASEVCVVQTIRKSFPELVHLTTVNAYSLVLHSPARFGPDVLFSADSGFGSRKHPPVFRPPVKKNMLVTAPHHGSKDCENEEAYHRLKESAPSNCFRTLTWVRSDQPMCVGGRRPGKMYLKQHRRFCTNCRGCSGDGQDVVMIGSNGCWKPAKGVSPCCCSKR